MGHQPEHVALAAAHPGDVALGAVGVATGRVSEDDLAVCLHVVEYHLRRVIAARRVLDRDRQPRFRAARLRERSVVFDHHAIDLAADEAQSLVGQQRAGQQARLAEDLKAVADAEHEPALAGELGDGLHHRREARDRAHAQVVAIAEAAGHDHGIGAAQVALGVPEQLCIPHPLRRQLRVDLVAGAGEADDAELHPPAGVEPLAGAAVLTIS